MIIRFMFIIFNQMSQENNKQTPFLRKMCSILEDEAYKNIIKWNPEKTMIHILSIQKMEEQILPKYFRHNKFPSFIRQLNLYGFKKLRKTSANIFTHDKLLEGKEILSIISKKSQNRFETKQNTKKESQPEQNRHEVTQNKSEVNIAQRIEIPRSEQPQPLHRFHYQNPCYGYVPAPTISYSFGDVWPQNGVQGYNFVNPGFNVIPYPSNNPNIGFNNYHYKFY